MAILILLLFLSIVFLSWWWNRNSIVFNWPVLGMLPALAWNHSRIHDMATKALKLSGGTFLFKGPWFTGLNFMLISDPMNVNYILTKNFSNYNKGREFKDIFEPLGDSIFSADSDNWRTQRRLFNSLLSDKRFTLTLESATKHKIMNGLFLVLENAVELGSEVDIQVVFKRFMFDNICLLSLGFDPNSLSPELPQVPADKAFDQIEEVIFYRHVVPASIWKLQRWLHIGKEKKTKKAQDIFGDFARQCIARKRELLDCQSRINQTEGENFDLLTMFLTNDSAQSNNAILEDLAINFMAAGRDTISACLVWFFWLVAKTPSVEKKILEEIKANLQESTGDNIRLFSFKELEKLIYLHAVICEVLRLYPSVPFGQQKCIAPDVLPSGHQIPINMRILISMYSMGRMESIWGEDCLEFKPERWISEQGQIKHVKAYRFITFNAGPRTCVGKSWALVEVKAVASAVIWNYSLQVVENHPISPKNTAVLHMQHGLKVRVSKRVAP